MTLRATFARSLLTLATVSLAACDEPMTDVDAGTGDAHIAMSADAGEPVMRRVRILGINDFHGAIAPSMSAPGAGALAATVAMLRADAEESIVVSAGDLIGGSPLESGYWRDEPTVETMNALGLSLNAIGNHELDQGPDELLRLIEGGRCHIDGCGPSGMPHEGAMFASLAANTFTDATRSDTLLAPYVVRELAGARIAFVGVTLEGTAAIAAGAGSLTFGDEADTVNALVPELQALGIETIVVLVHEGGAQSAGPNGCRGMSGAIVEIVSRMDPAIDVVLTGHTHQSYVCELSGHVVTSAGANGNLVTAVDLVFDGRGSLLEANATNVEVPRDMTPEPRVASVVDRWVEATRTIREREVGRITAAIARGAPAACNFVTDAMLAEGQRLDPDADVALMNLGGIRASILFGGAGGMDGVVDFGELYNAIPFNNRLVFVTLTGADLVAALDESGPLGTTPLCPSASLTFAWSASMGRTVPGSVRIGGTPIDLSARYRVIVNDYNFAGGEGYTVFQARGTSTRGGGLLVEAAERYLEANDPYTPDNVERITLAP